MLDPFEPGPNFGNFSGSTSGATGVGAGGFAGGRQRSSGFSQMGGRQGGVSPLFPQGGGMSSAAGGPFGSAPPGVPSFNQMMRGSYNMPLNSSTSSFKFSYQDMLRPGGNLGDLARPSASLMFSTSDLGNGMFFSAGTSYGHSIAGAPAAGLGSNASPEGKHSGPALALKLSF
jgi:hypothetical protein